MCLPCYCSALAHTFLQDEARSIYCTSWNTRIHIQSSPNSRTSSTSIGSICKITFPIETVFNEIQNQLRRALLRSELLKKGEILQNFAYATDGRNRYIGTPGHNATVNYLVDTLSALDYYDVEVQPFTVPSASGALSVAGVSYEVAPMTFTAEGTVSGPVVLVSNLGCDPVSWISIGL